MKIKAITFLGVAGLIALAGGWWRGLDSQPAGQVAPAPASAAVVLSATSQSPPTLGQLAPRVVPALDLTRIPARVRPVIDMRQEFRSRLGTIHSLGKDLTPQELTPLYDFLRTPEAGDEKTRGGEQVLKNDLLSLLRQQANPPVGLTRLLIELSRDATQDPVMRAYSLQHLHAWYSQLAEENSPVTVPEQERAEMRQAFWGALKDSDPTVAGTGLLCLHRLSEVHAEFAPEQITATALKFCQDDTFASLARSTALQICAERKLDQALPVILELARGASSIPLQISAIAALGNLGGPDQVGFLERLTAGENERLHGPARMALHQIQQRHVN